MKRYTLEKLNRMPTINGGQFDNLKLDDGDTRVWLSRGTVADGEPYDNKVTIETLTDGRWCITDVYQAEGGSK